MKGLFLYEEPADNIEKKKDISSIPLIPNQNDLKLAPIKILVQEPEEKNTISSKSNN